MEVHYFMRNVTRTIQAATLIIAAIALASIAQAQQPTLARPGNNGQGNNAQGAVQANSTQGNTAQSNSPTDKSGLKPADQKVKDAYDKSKTAASLDDFTQIITFCQDGIDGGITGDSAAYAHKLQAWAYNRRGEKYSEAHNEKQALKDFEAAIALQPGLWKAIQNRGVSRAYLGDTKGAMADFDTVVKMNPNYANAWFNRGELKYDQGDVTGALADYNRAIDLQPADAGFYNSRGHAQGRLGNFRDALADYDRAVQIDPNDAAALVNRGDAYRQQGMYGPAASDYRDAIRINSKLGRAYLSTAWLMATCPEERFREPDKAISAAQRAIELDGDKDYRYLDTLAAAQANAGKFDDAKATLNKALNEVPPSEVAHLKTRLELYETGRAFREGAPAESVKPASANMRTP
jgi:tetratricopeptide (TPR) repeat protein